MRISALLFTAVFLLAGCGDPDADVPDTEEPVDEPAEVSMPDWYDMNEDDETVTITLVAGETSSNNYWNYNGLLAGDAIVRVPVDYEVTVNLINEDPAMGHSVGVGELQDSYPSTFSDEEAEPLFDGAVTPNPTSMTESTQPGEEDSFTFTADEAGEFALICYVDGHAQQNMWLEFHITDDMDDVGVEM